MYKILTFGFLCLTFSSYLKGQMLKDTLDLDEVIITGTRIEVSRRNLPMNVSVIHQDQIDEVYESSVMPMISRRVPGLFVTERGGTGFGRTGSTSAGNITIRGVGGSPNSQILVLVDGHPQYMGLFGHPFPNSYVASDLQRVEVIRGPASILYGSNAMGGVLNLITREQKKEGMSGMARIQYGSFNTQKVMAGTGFRKGKFNMFVSYNHDQSDGHRDSMDFNINNGYVKVGYELSKNIRINADFNLADYTSYDPGRIDMESPTFKADILRGKAALSIQNKYEHMEGALFAWYNYGQHDFSDNWKSSDESYGLSLYQGLRMFPGNTFTMGAEFKNSGGIGNMAFPPTYANKWLKVNEAAGYLVVRQDIQDILSLSAGLRVENNSMAGIEWVPQLGASWHLNSNTDIKASLSKGYRYPTLTELYLFSPNPELKPESMMNYEAGVARSLLEGRLNAELSLYYIVGENLIQTGPNPTPPPMFTRLNSGKFDHRGIEVEIDYLPGKDFMINANYAYLSMDRPKIAAPEHQAFVGVNYKFQNFSFSVQTNYIGGLYTSVESTEGVNAVNQESYFLLDAKIKYHAGKFVELFLSGKNLTDTKYQIDWGYPMPGINYMLGVGFRF